MRGTRERDHEHSRAEAQPDAEDHPTGATDEFTSPERFFREFTARPDIDRIMTALAQIDQAKSTAGATGRHPSAVP